MYYSIGDIAELFGLTTQGIRYLEKQGLIQSERDEKTGYRRFSRNQVAKLKNLRTYQTLGFSAEEILDLRRRDSQDAFLDAMETHLEKLRKQIEELQDIQHSMERRIELIRTHTLKGDTYELTMRPEMLFLPRIESSDRNGQKLDEFIRVEKGWTLSMPPVTLCGRFFRADGSPETGYSRFGSVVMAEDAVRLGLPMCDDVIALERCLCVHAIVAGGLADDIPIGQLHAYAGERGMRQSGEVYGRMVADLSNAPKGRRTIHEVWMPVREV